MIPLKKWIMGKIIVRVIENREQSQRAVASKFISPADALISF
jgi:hypothetical protein